MSDTSPLRAAVEATVAAAKAGGMEDWQALFVLARRLKAVMGYDPEANSNPVLLCCHRLGIPAVVGWTEFLARWEMAAVPDGVNVVPDAASLARSRPVRVRGCDPVLSPAASFAYYLALFTRPAPFFLSCGTMGAFAAGGMPGSKDPAARLRQAGGRVLQRLCKLGVLEVADPNWRFNPKNSADNRCISYRFVGVVEG